MRNCSCEGQVAGFANQKEQIRANCEPFAQRVYSRHRDKMSTPAATHEVVRLFAGALARQFSLLNSACPPPHTRAGRVDRSHPVGTLSARRHVGVVTKPRSCRVPLVCGFHTHTSPCWCLFALSVFPLAAQMLDDNQSLIMAILENQNLGKLDQCAQCVGGGLVDNVHSLCTHWLRTHRLQQRLQANLLYLSALADAQPAPNAGTGAQAAPQ